MIPFEMDDHANAFSLISHIPAAFSECILVTLAAIFVCTSTSPAADPGFPVGGGVPTHLGVPTSDAATFRCKRAQK